MIQGSSDINKGTLQVSTPDWQVGTVGVNGDPYRLMPEIIYRAYHQQKALQKPAGAAMVSRGGFGGEAPGGWGGTTAQQMAALSPAQTPTFSRMAGMGPNQIPGYVSAQPWEAGAVASGYVPAGYDAPQRPQNATISPDYDAIYGNRYQQPQQPQKQAQAPHEETGDEALRAYYERLAAAKKAMG